MSAERALLLDVGTPELYRRNPFRMAGVHTGTPVAAVRQRLLALPDGTGPADALARLDDPRARLVDGFFWLRPDPALDALAAGDVAGTRARWESAAAADPVARHNLAVLCHAAALDGAADETFWPDAYRHWLALRDTDAAWTPALRRVRRVLPLALALVSTRLAVDTATGGGPAEVALRHWRLPFEAGLPDGVAARAARIAAAPLHARLDAAREAVDDGTPAEAEAALRNLVAPLAALRLFERAGTDDAAELFLRGAARHGAAGAWAVARDLLALAAPLARTATAVDAVQRHLRAAEQELRVHEAVEAYRRRKLREESEARSARAAREAAEERRERAAREAAARRAEALRMAAQRQVMESRRRTRAARSGVPAERVEPHEVEHATADREAPAPPPPRPRPDTAADRAARELLAFAADWDGCHYCQRVRRTSRDDHSVSLARGADVATVTVPRCRRCRWRQTGRASVGLVLMTFTVLMVVIVTPASARWMSWTAVGVGMTGALLGLLALRRGTRARWLHTLTYPPVADLWREGWRRH